MYGYGIGSYMDTVWIQYVVTALRSSIVTPAFALEGGRGGDVSLWLATTQKNGKKRTDKKKGEWGPLGLHSRYTFDRPLRIGHVCSSTIISGTVWALQ